ncbi:MAG TPA: copper homeostasis periplasmic binding protein CopC [Rhizomicrobium sp.]|nr:copper homeostasis periplasmic binding protein CopC [Rhizomicrobium sp.]
MQFDRFMPAVALASLLCPASALAHPLPKSASPAPNAVLRSSPTEIRIGFSEGFVPAFSGMEVDNAQGQAMPAGSASADPGDAKEMVLPLTGKLGPGTYAVKWHAVGDDTHQVSGHYSFQVAP